MLVRDDRGEAIEITSERLVYEAEQHPPILAHFLRSAGACGNLPRFRLQISSSKALQYSASDTVIVP
jgi:hypothetical protein